MWNEFEIEFKVWYKCLDGATKLCENDSIVKVVTLATTID